MPSLGTTNSSRRKRTDSQFEKLTLGRSVKRRPIDACVFPGERGTILVFGGFHGDEPKSVHVARRLVESLEQLRAATAADSGRRSSHGADLTWVIVPIVNPDGYERRTRRNASGVDLNRNFPTKNWALGRPRSRMFGGRRPASEPETRAVVRAVERFAPRCIITIHSINRNRFCNNYDGPGALVAKAMSRNNGYPITASIGYPTPGSFGTWAGGERGIATITLELPSHHSSTRCWKENREAILGVLS